MTNLEGSYPPVLPGLVSCSRCGALLLDAAAARKFHDAFHAGLRRMWEATNAR